jgi:hypothetical protein
MDSQIDRWAWVRDLIKNEEQMENAGIIDLDQQCDIEKFLIKETSAVLSYFKTEILEASQLFNTLKTSTIGKIKIYNIAKTNSDFMVFRNGYKMIFSMKKPGMIAIRFNFIGGLIDTANPTVSAASAQSVIEENVLEAKIGAFGDLQWLHKEQTIKLTSVVKHHFSVFIRESSK